MDALDQDLSAQCQAVSWLSSSMPGLGGDSDLPFAPGSRRSSQEPPPAPPPSTSGRQSSVRTMFPYARRRFACREWESDPTRMQRRVARGEDNMPLSATGMISARFSVRGCTYTAKEDAVAEPALPGGECIHFAQALPGRVDDGQEQNGTLLSSYDGELSSTRSAVDGKPLAQFTRKPPATCLYS